MLERPSAVVRPRPGRGRGGCRPARSTRRRRKPGRTLGQILRANVCTRFNAILGTLFVVVLIVGPLQDALFGPVLVINTGIGVYQEVRAKRTLDNLAS